MKARTALTIALVVVAAGLAVGLAAGLASSLGRFRLLEKDVSDRFVVYIEGTNPAGKLVVLEGIERFTASRDFTARILSLVKVDARIEISAMADTAYYVDLADPSQWKASWAPKTGRLRLTVPPPGLLPPAVRTDTIEVKMPLALRAHETSAAAILPGVVLKALWRASASRRGPPLRVGIAEAERDVRGGRTFPSAQFDTATVFLIAPDAL